MIPNQDIAKALSAVELFKETLRAKLVEEILEERESFDDPVLGSAKGLLDKYAQLFWAISLVENALTAGRHRASFGDRSAKDIPEEGPDQHLCFSCNAKVRKDWGACPYCGWTWQQRQRRWMPSQQRYTQRAQHALEAARGHAERLRYPAIEPEHLLLALLEDADCIGGKALRDMGAELWKVSREFLPRRVEGLAAPVNPAPGPALEQALVDAWEACRDLEHGYVSTGHLLLGLTRLIGDAQERLGRLLPGDPNALRDVVTALLRVDASQ